MPTREGPPSAPSFVWELSGNRTFEVHVTGGRLTKEDFEALRDYLKVAERVAPSASTTLALPEGGAVDVPDIP